MILAFVVYVILFGSCPLQAGTDEDSVIYAIKNELILSDRFLQIETTQYSSGEWNIEYPGMATVFSEYGLQEFLKIEFSTRDDRIISAEIYRMEDNGGAYGLFSVLRNSEGSLSDFGNESYKDDNCIYFWKSNYFVRIFSEMHNEISKNEIYLVADSIDNKIEKDGRRPLIIELMPEEGFVRERTRYFRGSAGLEFNLPFGQDDIAGFNEGVFSDFGTHQLLLLEYETSEASENWLGKIRSSLDNNKRYTFLNTDSQRLFFEDKDNNNLVFEVIDKYIVIFIGKDITRQPEIFEKIEDSLYNYEPYN